MHNKGVKWGINCWNKTPDEWPTKRRRMKFLQLGLYIGGRKCIYNQMYFARNKNARVRILSQKPQCGRRKTWSQGQQWNTNTSKIQTKTSKYSVANDHVCTEFPAMCEKEDRMQKIQITVIQKQIQSNAKTNTIKYKNKYNQIQIPFDHFNSNMWEGRQEFKCW